MTKDLRLTPEQSELAAAHLTLTNKFITIAKRSYSRFGSEAIHDAAITALIKSARTYSEAYGRPFGMFLYYNVQRELQRMVRDSHAQKRKGISLSLDAEFSRFDGNPLSLHDLLISEDEYAFFDDEMLHLLLAQLDERERACVNLTFAYEIPQREIGKQLGISQAHVGRITRKALVKMRTYAERFG